MKVVIHKDFLSLREELDRHILNYDSLGKPFGNQARNSLKLFEIQGFILNVKSFKIPNFFNRISYRFFRKSKAQRSYEYANKLLDSGIGTPRPIAFYEFTSPFFFHKSFYVSEQQESDYTYRDLTKRFDIPDYETILRAFTRFTYTLHEHHILFLDHSPGNTLIRRTDGGYEFFLVDLNRMKFKPLDFKERIKNFARLTTHKSMVETMSDEYAKCIGEDYQNVFSLMWRYTEDFQRKFQRKKRLKKRLKFWK